MSRNKHEILLVCECREFEGKAISSRLEDGLEWVGGLAIAAFVLLAFAMLAHIVMQAWTIAALLS